MTLEADKPLSASNFPLIGICGQSEPVTMGMRLCVLLSLIFFACDKEVSISVEKTDARMQVLSIISAALEPVEVYVGVSYPEMTPISLSQATVIISSPENRYILREIKPGLYCDEPHRINVQEGQVYKVEVISKDGMYFCDSTRVPCSPSVVNIHQGDTLRFIENAQGLHKPVVILDSTNNAAGYRVTLIGPESKEYLWYDSKFSDSLEISIPLFGFDRFFQTDTVIRNQCTLRVWAKDSSACYMEEEFIREVGKAKWNLVGSMSLAELYVIMEYKYEKTAF